MNCLYKALLPMLLLCACNNNTKSIKPTSSESIGCYMPATTDEEWYSSGKKAPMFDGLDGIDFPISTAIKTVQQYFNQGLMLAYGFNHAEAARSFYEAARQDSTCAMAYWGYAYVLGPNYNAGMEADHYQRAYAAVTKAKALAHNSRPVEQALIMALSTRYQATPPEDRAPLDKAYATAMKKVYEQFPNHADVGVLYAEALMNLHPWDLYDKQSKKPREWTAPIVALLEKLMKAHPLHAGAHHFYIHAMETSATPEKALASAALLDTLVKGAGHLLHMPSHIYINTGHYHKGSLSNLQAVKVDSLYGTACHAQGVYPLSYYPHNYHFLVATAALEGNAALAWMAAQQLQQHTATAIMDKPEWGTLQHYYTIPYYTAVKLEKWREILAMPAPVKKLAYPKAIWHYARGMAFIAEQNIAAAQKEQDSLTVLAGDSSLQTLTIWNINTMADLTQIAQKLLAAAIAAKQHKTDVAVQWLKDAIAIEDRLNYNEPPDWFFSVRHHLGALLIKAGQYAAAEKIYREDLQTWKKNGWALKGLQQALALQQKQQEAATTQAAFEEAWQYADIALESSSTVFYK